MAVERRRLSGGRLREASYDASNCALEIAFSDGSTRCYRGVPPEVWRRLIAAPNPASYHEDRIEEEYAFTRVRSDGGTNSRSALDDLFGAAPPDRD